MPKNLPASLLAAVWLAMAGAAHATPAGHVAALSGTLLAVKQDGRTRVLGVGSSIEAGDTLMTDSASTAHLRFSDGGSVQVRADSQFRIERYDFAQGEPGGDSAIMVLIRGGLRAVTGLLGKRGRAAAYSMRAPNATIGIRGTDFGLQQCVAGSCAGKKTVGGAPLADGLHVEVSDGTIVVGNDAGSVEVSAGGFAYVGTGAPLVVSDGYRAPGSGVECVID